MSYGALEYWYIGISRIDLLSSPVGNKGVKIVFLPPTCFDNFSFYLYNPDRSYFFTIDSPS